MSNGPVGPTGAPAQWFDVRTLFTAAGATTAVVIVTAVLQRLFPGLPAPWVALGLSLLIALVAISVQKLPLTVVTVFVALINGIMTYAAAVGINTVATESPPSTVIGAPTPAPAPARYYRWWP